MKPSAPRKIAFAAAALLFAGCASVRLDEGSGGALPLRSNFRPEPQTRAPGRVLLASEAAGYALHSYLTRLPAKKRARLLRGFELHASLGAPRLSRRTRTPPPLMLVLWLEERALRFGTVDAALAAFFVGDERVASASAALNARKVHPTFGAIKRAVGDPLLPHLPALARVRRDATLFGLGWPVVGEARLSSYYGPRYHPLSQNWRRHRGVDIALPIGTPIFAPEDGVVKWVRRGKKNGLSMAIDHPNGVMTLYLHTKRILVQPGQMVRHGQLIALSGNTGRTTGPHLHYEVIANYRPVNPLDYRVAPPTRARPAWLNAGKVTGSITSTVVGEARLAATDAREAPGTSRTARMR